MNLLPAMILLFCSMLITMSCSSDHRRSNKVDDVVNVLREIKIGDTDNRVKEIMVKLKTVIKNNDAIMMYMNNWQCSALYQLNELEVDKCILITYHRKLEEGDWLVTEVFYGHYYKTKEGMFNAIGW